MRIEFDLEIHNVRRRQRVIKFQKGAQPPEFAYDGLLAVRFPLLDFAQRFIVHVDHVVNLRDDFLGLGVHLSAVAEAFCFLLPAPHLDSASGFLELVDVPFRVFRALLAVVIKYDRRVMGAQFCELRTEF